MAQFQPKLEIVINPADPVKEICEVISAVCQYHSDKELDVLNGIQAALSKRIESLKGDEACVK